MAFPAGVIQYAPRRAFLPYHNRTERFACLVFHRRAGKTVAAVNDLQRDVLTCERPNPRVAYIAPFYKQAKAVAWDYAKQFARDVEGAKPNESELRIDYPHGGRFQLFGADNYEAIRGMYFDAVVMDEPADFPANAWPMVIRPTLADRKGRATFIGTPKGKNEFWETYEHARKDDNWFCKLLKASVSSIVDQEELDEALKIMGQDRFDQEFECSFEAAIQGAYYGHEMKEASNDGRVAKVPYEPSLPVVTAWDLGIGDSTAIWFAQFHGAEKRIIDYYEASGAGLDHYVQHLQEKKYLYGQHVLPHDVEVRELGTGKSRLEVLKGLGLTDITIAPKLAVDDGIQAARSFIATCWFDEEKCFRGIEALRQYRRDYDEKGRTFRSRPLHDWTSHGADAFRYLAVGYRPATPRRSPQKRRGAWAA
ncbi:terminase family protein [uncultured Ruegeria sp.]|uniref:terminase large subunit domain-containing protein n=1 Tax=uncultured Ruegeria sp. TaxID=259304 RepID=UPI002621F468|nr:terminase family protein [uncultured Ruegeria sp.]